METVTRIRDASTDDVGGVIQIGTAALPSQYAGLVDPAAVQSAVEQSYSRDAVLTCIHRCAEATDAHFLVVEQEGQVVGFLHFDSFGPEPELHRLYVSKEARSGGLGRLMIETLHERLGPNPYMLLVMVGNDRAVRFYERHGCRIAEDVDGLTYYRERMGVEFPASTKPFTMHLMRRDT